MDCTLLDLLPALGHGTIGAGMSAFPLEINHSDSPVLALRICLVGSLSVSTGDIPSFCWHVELALQKEQK